MHEQVGVFSSTHHANTWSYKGPAPLHPREWPVTDHTSNIVHEPVSTCTQQHEVSALLGVCGITAVLLSAQGHTGYSYKRNAHSTHDKLMRREENGKTAAWRDSHHKPTRQPRIPRMLATVGSFHWLSSSQKAGRRTSLPVNANLYEIKIDPFYFINDSQSVHVVSQRKNKHKYEISHK